MLAGLDRWLWTVGYGPGVGLLLVEVRRAVCDPPAGVWRLHAPPCLQCPVRAAQPVIALQQRAWQRPRPADVQLLCPTPPLPAVWGNFPQLHCPRFSPPYSCRRRWAPLAIAAAGVALLALSRFIFARPKPSPLDPMFARMRRVGAALLPVWVSLSLAVDAAGAIAQGFVTAPLLAGGGSHALAVLYATNRRRRCCCVPLAHPNPPPSCCSRPERAAALCTTALLANFAHQPPFGLCRSVLRRWRTSGGWRRPAQRSTACRSSACCSSRILKWGGRCSSRRSSRAAARRRASRASKGDLMAVREHSWTACTDDCCEPSCHVKLSWALSGASNL